MRTVLLASGLLMALWSSPSWALDCTTRPDLCNRPITSEINEPDLSVAHDIVFLGDGYTEGELHKFVQDVKDYIAGLKAASNGSGILNADPGVFNFHRIDVVSQTSNVDNGERGDTALGVSLLEGGISVFPGPVTFAAAQAPDVDTWVLVVNSRGGRANASVPSGHMTGGSTRVNRAGTETFIHELGHAIFGLRDEYTTYARCAPQAETSLLPTANLTLDPTGAKFARASQWKGPPREGGGHYTHCIYRPEKTCGMGTSGKDWCSVCARHIRTQVQERRMGDLDAPYLTLASPDPKAVLTGKRPLRVVGYDSLGEVEISVFVDGAMVSQSPTRILHDQYWDTTTLPDGLRTFRMVARDSAGNTEAQELELLVLNQIGSPVSISFPPDRVSLLGELEVRFDVPEGVTPMRIELVVDGVRTGAVEGPPWSIPWDSTSVINGWHQLAALTWTETGLPTISPPIEVVVNNPPQEPLQVELLNPLQGDHVHGRVDMMATAINGTGQESVSYWVNNAKSAYNHWETERHADGTVKLMASMENPDGQRGSTTIDVVVDNTPPTVALISPRTGTYEQPPRVVIEAADAMALDRVELWLDGEVWRDAAHAPFEFELPPELSAGLHTLRGRAWDRAGNRADTDLVRITLKAAEEPQGGSPAEPEPEPEAPPATGKGCSSTSGGLTGWMVVAVLAILVRSSRGRLERAVAVLLLGVGLVGCPERDEEPPNLSLSVASSQLEVRRGATASLTIALNAERPTAQPVTLRASGLPGGITVPEVVVASGGDSAEVVFAASPEAATGAWSPVAISAHAGDEQVDGPITVSLRVLDAPGKLDASFGNGGTASLHPSNWFAGHHLDIEVLDDDAIVVAINEPGKTSVPLFKLRPDGSADTTFGQGGRVELREGAENILCSRPIRAGAGRMILGCQTNSGTLNNRDKIFLVRLNPDGRRDESFGQGGRLRLPTAPSSSYDALGALTVLGDGTILAGTSQQYSGQSGMRTALARFLPDGTRDTSFGEHGWARLPVGGGSQHVVPVSSGYRVFAVRSFVDPADAKGFVVGLDHQGLLDTTFGDGGIIKLARSLVDGDAAADGSSFVLAETESEDAKLWAFDPGGQSLKAFGTGGSLEVPAVPSRQVLLGPEGKVYALGAYSVSALPEQRVLLQRMSRLGELDETFLPAVPRSDRFELAGAAFQSNGRIVVVAKVGDDLALYRFWR